MEVTKLESPGFKNPISYYVMSEDQIAEICRVAGEAGGKAAIKKYKEEAKAKEQEYIDRRYHNTNLLLNNYRKLKLSVENAVFTIRQVEAEQSANEILNLMMGRDDGDLLIQSVKESKAKTAIILKHIDTMLDVYKAYCMNSSDDLDERRYNILVDRYIATPALTISSIAEKYYLSEVSVYADLKAAKEVLSALIFGIDGIFNEKM